MHARPLIRAISAANLAYAPQYLARELGFFEEAGVEVEFIGSPPGSSSIVDRLRDGDVDLLLGSAVFAHQAANDLEGGARIVAQVNQNSRHFLFAPRDRMPAADFSWRDLSGKSVVIAPTFVPTSWIAFREALHRHGVSLDSVNVIVGYRPEFVVDEFMASGADLLFSGGEEADDARLAIVSPAYEGYGPIPWSVYCSTASWRDGNAAALAAFRAGLGRAQRWAYEQPPAAVAAALAPAFPEREVGAIERTVELYVRARFWAETPDVDSAALAEWGEALTRWGLLPEGTDFAPLLR